MSVISRIFRPSVSFTSSSNETQNATDDNNNNNNNKNVKRKADVAVQQQQQQQQPSSSTILKDNQFDDGLFLPPADDASSPSSSEAEDNNNNNNNNNNDDEALAGAQQTSRLEPDRIVFDDVHRRFMDAASGTAVRDENLQPNDTAYEHDDNQADFDHHERVFFINRENKVRGDELVKFVKKVCAFMNVKPRNVIEEDYNDSDWTRRPQVVGLMDVSNSVYQFAEEALSQIKLKIDHMADVDDFHVFIFTDVLELRNLFARFISTRWSFSNYFNASRTPLQSQINYLTHQEDMLIMALRRWTFDKYTREFSNSTRGYSSCSSRSVAPLVSARVARSITGDQHDFGPTVSRSATPFRGEDPPNTRYENLGDGDSYVDETRGTAMGAAKFGRSKEGHKIPKYRMG